MNDTSNAALLLMDYELGICSGPSAGEVERRGVLARAATCLDAARKAAMPVIHVRVGFVDDYTNKTSASPRFAGIQERKGLLLGTRDTEFCDEVKPASGEPVVTKSCVDPFIGTNLMELLIGRGIRRVYLGGVSTNMVVESTARHAADSGIHVTVIEDICASGEAAMHEFAVTKTLPMFGELCSSAEFIERAEHSEPGKTA